MVNRRLLIILPLILVLAVLATAWFWPNRPTPSGLQPAVPTPTPAYIDDITYPGQTGQTALALLEQRYPSTKTTGNGVNTSVATINGWPSPSQAKLWAFYLNGHLAEVTPASYVTQATDTIEWKLEDY